MFCWHPFVIEKWRFATWVHKCRSSISLPIVDPIEYSNIGKDYKDNQKNKLDVYALAPDVSGLQLRLWPKSTRSEFFASGIKIRK